MIIYIEDRKHDIAEVFTCENVATVREGHGVKSSDIEDGLSKQLSGVWRHVRHDRKRHYHVFYRD